METQETNRTDLKKHTENEKADCCSYGTLGNTVSRFYVTEGGDVVVTEMWGTLYRQLKSRGIYGASENL